MCLQEIHEKLKGGYICKTTFEKIKQSYPLNFKLSPIAIIPHKSRAYRCILDLSFQSRINGKEINSLNFTTILKVSQISIFYLGQVIKRLIYLMAKQYNIDQPFIFVKCDIKGRFMRMCGLLDAWSFAYVLPSEET